MLYHHHKRISVKCKTQSIKVLVLFTDRIPAKSKVPKSSVSRGEITHELYPRLPIPRYFFFTPADRAEQGESTTPGFVNSSGSYPCLQSASSRHWNHSPQTSSDRTAKPTGSHRLQKYPHPFPYPHPHPHPRPRSRHARLIESAGMPGASCQVPDRGREPIPPQHFQAFGPTC